MEGRRQLFNGRRSFSEITIIRLLADDDYLDQMRDRDTKEHMVYKIRVLLSPESNVDAKKTIGKAANGERL